MNSCCQDDKNIKVVFKNKLSLNLPDYKNINAVKDGLYISGGYQWDQLGYEVEALQELIISSMKFFNNENIEELECLTCNKKWQSFAVWKSLIKYIMKEKQDKKRSKYDN